MQGLLGYVLDMGAMYGQPCMVANHPDHSMLYASSLHRPNAQQRVVWTCLRRLDTSSYRVLQSCSLCQPCCKQDAGSICQGTCKQLSCVQLSCSLPEAHNQCLHTQAPSYE